MTMNQKARRQAQRSARAARAAAPPAAPVRVGAPARAVAAPARAVAVSNRLTRVATMLGGAAATGLALAAAVPTVPLGAVAVSAVGGSVAAWWMGRHWDGPRR